MSGSLQKINVGEAVLLRFVNGLSLQQIGDMYNVTASAVQQSIKKYLEKIGSPQILEAYTKNKSAFLNVAEASLITDMLDPDKRAAASLNNSAYAFGTIHKANLLEQGKSTENIATHAVAADVLKELEEIRKAMEEQEA